MKFLSEIDQKYLVEILKKYDLTPAESMLSKSLIPPRSNFLGTKNQTAEKNSIQKSISSYIINGIVLKSNGLEPLSKLFPQTNVNLNFLEKSDFVSAMNAGNYDFMIVGYGITIRDVEFLSNFFHSKTLPNFAKVKSNVIDRLIDESLSATHPKISLQNFEKVLSISEEEGFYKPLFHLPLLYVLNDELKSKYNSNIITSPFFDLTQIELRN